MFRVKKARSPREYFRKAKKSKAGKDALTKLNDYLNANTAEPMYWLHNMFTNQQNAITYKELREAIRNGYMDEATLQAWQQDYAKFVVNRLAPMWQKAAQAAAPTIDNGGWIFDAGGVGMTRYIADRGARFVTGVSAEAREAIQAMIGAGAAGQYTVDELARMIRPLIGLNKPQATANLKYYTQVRDNLLAKNPGMKKTTAEKRAQESAMKYAERQLRQRAQMIAQTELAAAHCAGYREYVREAQVKGLMGKGFFVWDTAVDEAVCSICGALDGTQTSDNGQYSINGQHVSFRLAEHPPAHPRCRCAEHFEETEPPAVQSDDLDELRSMPQAERINALGGEDGGRQREALITSSVINDDVDLDNMWHARIITDFDDNNYSITIRMEVTLKPLTELAKNGIMTVSNEALAHSTIGEYSRMGRIVGGCHTEAGLQELNRRGIEYNIVRTASNGVRLGNIPSHKEKFKRMGTGQAWFPSAWNEETVMLAGTVVANSNTQIIENHYKIGVFMGVLLRVELDSSGNVVSVCPDYDQDELEGVDWSE